MAKVLKMKLLSKRLVEALNRYEKQEIVTESRFVFRTQKKYSSETKPNTKLVLLCLQLANPINKMLLPKMFITLIYLKNSTFLSLKLIVDTD